MRRIGLAAALLLASCSGGESVTTAESAIATFHVRLNAGQYEQIYAVSDPQFKKAVSEPEFEKLLGAVHGKLGAYRTGKNSGWRVNYNSSGNNVVVQFDSSFEKGKAVETFTYAGVGNAIKLLGYNINSNTLITG
jgi:hypothetical protein